jgi:hypothetical protein
MKGKVVRGSGFRGALDYVLDSGARAAGNKNPEIVASNMSANNAKALANEFGISRALRPDIERPVWHCSLSLPAGERLDGEKWGRVVDSFREKLGFTDNHQFIAVRHSDTKYDHIHIITSRVSLDSKVWLGQWEARQVIEATQQLEVDFGLTLTPGLGDANSESRQVKKLSAGELNMAARTGEAPPKMKLQALLDEALEMKPTAVEFAEMLTMAGVTVQANIASTGRMNGFSFEIDGIAFKGSQLGKKYGFEGLRKNGLDYEQNRDGSELEKYKPRPANADGATQPVEPGRADSEPPGPTPANARKFADGITGRSGNPSDGAERNPANPTGFGEHIHDGNEGHGERVNEPERSEIGRDGEQDRGQTQQPEQAGRGDASSNTKKPESSSSTSQSSGTSNRSGEPDTSGTSKNPQGSLDSSGRDSGNGSSDWAIRFKQQSAARRLGRVDEQSKPARTRVDTADIAAIRQIDPTHVIQQLGFEVKPDGQRHISIRRDGDEYYRATRTDTGVWLVCDVHENPLPQGSDNIGLVRELTGCTFVEALYRLNGGTSLSDRLNNVVATQSDPPKREPPKIEPASPPSIDAGRRYLQGVRKIAQSVVEYAEKVGFLMYSAGVAIFAGRDEKGIVRSATARATNPNAFLQKRDYKNSDKRYAPVLPGNPDSVWIVEGGTDALALHSLAKRANEQAPTVIVSGGNRNKGFLSMEPIQRIIKAAKKITIATENEQDDDRNKQIEKQASSDAAWQKQKEIIEGIIAQKQDGEPVSVGFYKPPAGVKDLAALNEMKSRDGLGEQENTLAPPPTPTQRQSLISGPSL